MEKTALLPVFDVEHNLPPLEGVPLFDFDHNNNTVTVVKSEIPLKYANFKGRGDAAFWATSQNQILGYFIGNLGLDENQYLVFDSDQAQSMNRVPHYLGTDYKDRYPNIVGKMCAEIVDRGVVSKWRSSPYMSALGRKMYDKLKGDPRLAVELVNQRYEVTKKR